MSKSKTPKYQGTTRDWTIAGEECGIDLSYLDSVKQEDIDKLRKLGLPMFADLRLPYLGFSEDNPAVENFFKKYPGVTVRAIPAKYRKDLRRRFRVGVYGYEECKEFLDEEVKGNEQDYETWITEWQPQPWGGIIFSKKDRALIEISRKGLEKLTHGQMIPDGIAVFACSDLNNFKSMRYISGWRYERKLMWNILQHIRINREPKSQVIPNIELILGYFELGITEPDDLHQDRWMGDVKFVEYKDTEGYFRKLR